MSTGDGWPAIDEPLLRARLSMDDAEFAAFIVTLADGYGRRTFTEALLQRAMAYPWTRPARSYLLQGDAMTLLHDLPAGAGDPVLGSTTAGRHALLAFGSNAAPSTLRAKFAHFPDADDRRVLVLAGALHDFDVGASAHPTGYGALPATLFPSPGTAVRAAVLHVTDAQFTLLTWSELSYALGRLQDVRFTVDEAGEHDGDLLAYVSRFGAFAPAGEPVALAAVPATGRTAPAWSQEMLLAAAARLALGPDSTAEDLVRAVFTDMPALVARIGPVNRASAPFASRRWRPWPGAAS